LCEKTSGKANRILVTEHMFQVLAGNPKIMHEHAVFEKTVKNKCLEFIQDHDLEVAKKMYNHFWKIDQVQLQNAHENRAQGLRYDDVKTF